MLINHFDSFICFKFFQIKVSPNVYETDWRKPALAKKSSNLLKNVGSIKKRRLTFKIKKYMILVHVIAMFNLLGI